MRIILFCQYYRTRDRERQAEIDTCLRANLRHPDLDAAVVFVEPDAPKLPEGRCPVQIIPHAHRLHYRDWLRRLAAEKDAICVLINADIELLEGLGRIRAALADSQSFVALSRYNFQAISSAPSLNDFPQWTQDCWALRSDALISDSLLHASAFPLGHPGCDNRIAHVMWSHGFVVKNPCYHIRTLHRHRQTTRPYSNDVDRLYGGATYVHPSLTLGEASELEHVIWTRSQQPAAGLQIQYKGEGDVSERLAAEDPERAQRFRDSLAFMGLSWDQRCMGSVHAVAPSGEAHGLGPLSEDAFFLPAASLTGEGVTLPFLRPQRLSGASVRLPRHWQGQHALLLSAIESDPPFGGDEIRSLRLSVGGGGQRTLLPHALFGEGPVRGVQLRLLAECPSDGATADEGVELVLFTAPRPEEADKSLRRIAASDPVDGADAAEPERPHPLTWRPRSVLGETLEEMEIVHHFGRRFVVRSQNGTLWFEDRYWPVIASLPRTALPLADPSARQMFLWGFAQPTLTLPSLETDSEREQARHWGAEGTAGCTELDAYQLHRQLLGPQVEGDQLHLYVAVPWSQLIDAGRDQTIRLQALQRRIMDLREALQGMGLELQTHSVCAHPDWSLHRRLFMEAGIGTLWVSHHPTELDGAVGIAVASWHLHPCPGTPPSTDSWRALPVAQKPFLASFQGVLSALPDRDRLHRALLALRDRHRWLIDIQERQAEVVDGDRQGEAAIRASPFRPGDDPDLRERQARVRRDSQFVLCIPDAPGGMLALWQTMGVGGIPVVLGDMPALPDRGVLEALGVSGWQDLLVVCPPEDLQGLAKRLESLEPAEIDRRGTLCLNVLHQLRQQGCFGPAVPRARLQKRPDGVIAGRRPRLTIPHYGEGDRYYWRRRKCAFYEVVLEWYQRGWVDIQFGDKGYFWWGDPGEILISDRDLIVDLHDGKIDPPRWQGAVPYRHGFFANQYHLPSARNHRLTYWAYAPVLLERFRQEIGRRRLADRCHESVFAGTVENETQEFFRNKFIGWESFIAVYACADKLNQAAQAAYSMPEYLELLASARFGVTFHGNGPRCYREIECLALGTPLIITEGVQTDFPDPLVEGLHFLRARHREDLPRLIASVDSDQWERMSRACWQWYERNASISALFTSLSHAVATLDLQARRHDTLYLSRQPAVIGDCMAARSLRVMDPRARVLWDPSPPAHALLVDPDDVVINELPFVGGEKGYIWTCRLNQLSLHLESLLASEHPQHKQLCTLLGYRLRNFLVEISGPEGAIPLESRLVDGRLHLCDERESARLSIDFDWSRRCAMKYPRLTRTLRGPVVLQQAVIMATLDYEREGQLLQYDLSDHFMDYHAAFNRLIPAAQLAMLCKLWRFQNCTLLQVTGSIHESGMIRDFGYAYIHPWRFELMAML